MRLWPEPTTAFQRRWNQNWLTVFLPGFVVFGLGGHFDLKPVALGGWLIAAVAGFRAWRLIRKYRRCTGCGRVSQARLGDDRTCLYCGLELPIDDPD